MNRQQNVLDGEMSLHDIKDKMQLEFAEQHADFITNNLETLIENTYRDAPVRKNPYPLTRRDRHNLKPNVLPLEKHWEEAIFRKWKTADAGLNPRVPFRKVVSYQVMLRDTNKNRGWGELDLLGATAENIPVAIELKIRPSEYLLRAVVEVLAYGITIRKAWNDEERSLSSQWAKVVGKTDSLIDLPLVVMAPAKYWEDVLRNNPKQERFQTPQFAIQSIQKLIDKMHHVHHYPLTFVKVYAESQPDESGLPVIIDAEVIDICSGLKS